MQSGIFRSHLSLFRRAAEMERLFNSNSASPLSFQAAQLIPSLSCTYPEEPLKYSILSQSIRNWSSCLSSSREEIQFPWSWREAWNLWMNTITNSMKLIIKDRERLRGPERVDRKNKTISPFQIYTHTHTRKPAAFRKKNLNGGKENTIWKPCGIFCSRGLPSSRSMLFLLTPAWNSALNMRV